MNGTSPLVRFVVRFRRAWIGVFDTVRAGYALGPKGTRARVVRFVVRFDGPNPKPSEIRRSVFPEPALAARKGGLAGGPGGAPLKGALPRSPDPRRSARRRAVDRLALLAWRHAAGSPRNRPRFRNLVLTAAARSANS